MAALFAVLVPVFSRMGLLPGHEKRDLEKLTVSSSAFTVFGLSCLIGGGCSFYYSTTVESPLVFQVLAAALGVLAMVLLVLGPVLRRRRNRAAE